MLECKVTETDRTQDPLGRALGKCHGLSARSSASISTKQIIREGRLDMSIARPVARMGYMDYSEGSDVFELLRPQVPNDLIAAGKG